jgi:subtilase family serine protease
LIKASGKRGTPDVAADANPSTGVWVFNSTLLGAPAWFTVGGTSVASPVWAGIVNAAGSIKDSSNAELIELYERDGATQVVRKGSCGPYNQYVKNGKYNFCTGLGSPIGYFGK